MPEHTADEAGVDAAAALVSLAVDLPPGWSVEFEAVEGGQQLRLLPPMRGLGGAVDASS